MFYFQLPIICFRISINNYFGQVSETDRRQKCQVDNCDFVNKDTTSSTGYKWKIFRKEVESERLFSQATLTFATDLRDR